MAVWVLLFVGGLNWGLIGLFDYNLVNEILRSVPEVERIVYVLVGLSALCMLGCKHMSCGMKK